MIRTDRYFVIVYHDFTVFTIPKFSQFYASLFYTSIYGVSQANMFKSNVRESWRVILVSKADIFHTESLRILAERLSQSETHLPLRQICYYSPLKEVGVFSTEIKLSRCRTSSRKEAVFIDYINTFLVSVAASIVGYYVCKWLDRDNRQ